MIKGKIEEGLYPRIQIEVAGNASRWKFSALIDTGFNADLGLHYSEITKIGLEIIDFARVDYADGESLSEPVCSAHVLWHSKWKEIEVVLSNDEEPAIGTRLLRGSVVTMNFITNTLTIEEPPKQTRKKKQ